MRGLGSSYKLFPFFPLFPPFFPFHRHNRAGGVLGKKPVLHIEVRFYRPFGLFPREGFFIHRAKKKGGQFKKDIVQCWTEYLELIRVHPF